MIALAFGLAATAAVMLMVAAFTPPNQSGPEPSKVAAGIGRLRARLRNDHKLRRQVITAVVVGLAAWVITGVAVMGVLAPAIALGAPKLLSKPSDASNSGLLEALETWTRTLAGLVATGESLERAVTRSVESTAAPLDGPVTRLSARLSAQQPLDRSMRLWADEVDDSLADMVAATIIIGSRRRAGGVEAALDGLAKSMTERLELRRQIDSEGAEPRTVAWFMTLFTLGLAVVGAFHPTISGAYASPGGQVVLTVLAITYVGLLIAMRRMAKVPADSRLFSPLGVSSR